jgi:hypothetical protein
MLPDLIEIPLVREGKGARLHVMSLLSSPALLGPRAAWRWAWVRAR